jgi:hypothetical protein
VSHGHKVTLDNALFAPASKAHLISVLTLNCSGEYTSHIDESSFWMTNTTGAIVLRGTVYKNRRLYGLSLSDAHTTHKPVISHTVASPDTAPPTALYASSTPDVETWHRRLGHCGFGTIVDMAQKHSVEVMGRILCHISISYQPHGVFHPAGPYPI